MDWKYKHFSHEAVFNALRENVLEAARATVVESLGGIGDTTDGFIAQGYSAFHVAIATFHITQAEGLTRVAVELQVERSSTRGYMLVDIGGYYNGQIDKWFAGIAQRLGSEPEQILVSKTTSGVRTQRGCMVGCLVWLLAGACLAMFAIPLDHALFPQSARSIQGPFSIVASIVALLAGVAAYRIVAYPDAPASKSIREHLPGTRKRKSQ